MAGAYGTTTGGAGRIGRRLPVVVAVLLCAAGALGAADTEGSDFLGGIHAYMPSVAGYAMFFGSLGVGLIAGLITGSIGAGGGYILTPALMSFGATGIMAVGTGQFAFLVNAIMGVTIHRKMGNVNVRLALWFMLGSVFGVTAGGKLNRAIFQRSPALSDAVISILYVVVLGVLGCYALRDWLRIRRMAAQPGAARETGAATPLARRLQSMKLAPRVIFDGGLAPGGRSIPVYPVIFCGLFVGTISAMMGIGGGVLIFPILVYGLGISTLTAVGTSVLQIVFMAFYSAIFQYAIYGFLLYGASIGMMTGSLVGVQIGAMVTRVVKGAVIRAFYAMTILAGFVNRLCALLAELADDGYIPLSGNVSAAIDIVGTVLFFGLVGFFAIWLFAIFIRNLGSFRGESAASSSGRIPLIVDRRKFCTGVAGLAVFFVVLVAILIPVRGGPCAAHRADAWFNRLSKSSAYCIPEALERASEFDGCAVDVSIAPGASDSADDLVALVELGGCDAMVMEDGRLHISGDFGGLARAALADAEEVFYNRHAAVGPHAARRWWVVFDGLTGELDGETQGGKSEFCRYIAVRVFEPAHNFGGIEPATGRGRFVVLALLLGGYVFYALWYGFSILMVFEGLGICAGRAFKNREAQQSGG